MFKNSRCEFLNYMSWDKTDYGFCTTQMGRLFDAVYNSVYRAKQASNWPGRTKEKALRIIRGLQALSVQFRFAFSNPYSSQTRFLNRPVAAPAEVAHFCRYKKNVFFDQFAFWRVDKRQYFCLQYPPFKTQIGRKIFFFVATEVGYFGGRRNWTV